MGLPNGAGVLNGVLEGVSHLFCSVLDPFLRPSHWHDWSLVLVALGMVFLWRLKACGCAERRIRSRCGGHGSRHCRRHCRRCLLCFAESHMRTLWEAWAVLQIYFSKSRLPWAKDYPFAISSAFITVETFLCVVLAISCKKSRRPPCRSLNKEPVRNKYMDISVTFQSAMLYFWCQVALMGLFVYWLNADKDTKEKDKVSALKWFIAVSLTMIAGEAEGGLQFSAGYWKKLLHTHPPKFTGRDRVHLWLRCCMDLLVNGFGRGIIMALAPLVLSVTDDQLEFLKDAVALFFVTKLDDLDAPKSFKECLLKIRDARPGQKARRRSRAWDLRKEEWADQWLEALREEASGSSSDEGSSDGSSSSDCSSDERASLA